MPSVKSVAVIGLGYIGLPITLLASKNGYKVYGIDNDPKKIKLLSDKKSYIDDVDDDEIANTKAIFTNDISKTSKVDVVIICVPTPVSANKVPNLGPVTVAISAIALHIKNGTLVVVESTINPGVCDETIIPLLEKGSGKKVGKDIYLAHCPERINPGDPKWNVSNINRVIGANSKPELNKAVKFYKSIIDAEVKSMGSLKEAEAVKIVENSFRDINIAFVNELAMSFHKLGINIENVIDGAATKPFAFIPHRPGCGVGGHCIPVDPYYLIEYARGNGFEHDFLRLARKINESMPQFTVDLLIEALNEIGMSLNGAKVTLLGLSYKKNVGDDRESPAHTIRNLLSKYGANLTIYDPYVLTKSTVKSLEDALKNSTSIIIATNHDEFKNIDPEILIKHKIKVVIDGRNIFRTDKNTFVKNGIIYRGIGI